VLNEPKLRVVEGDVRDEDAVAAAVKGHTCVVVCIGNSSSSSMSRSDVCAEGTKHIIAAMKVRHCTMIPP
jgi:nucleoside-diphosphate-sugar epimerase